MTSTEAKERVVNSLLSKLNKHPDVVSVELLEQGTKSLYMEFEQSKDPGEVKAMIEDMKETYLYNKQHYVVKTVRDPEVGSLTASVNIVVLNKDKLNN